MTALAEYRLWLRADNAVTRLGQDALEWGCVSKQRRDAILAHFAARERPGFRETGEGRADRLYAPYLERQARELSAINRDRAVAIPAAFDFGSVPGLSSEAVERLAAASPETLDQASRIAGITPAALAALHVQLTRLAA